MRHIERYFWLVPTLAFIIFLLIGSCTGAVAQDFNPQGITSTLTLAKAIQDGVEGQNYVYLAVIIFMFGMQAVKMLGASKVPSLKKHTASYSTAGGASVGAVMSNIAGSDPVQGAIGGAMVGNASSGLYSTVKSLFTGPLSYIPLLFTVGAPAALLVMQALKKTPQEKRKELMTDFDSAMKKAKKKKGRSTKDLEKWFSENL